MHNAIPLSVAALMAVAIIVIGCFYILSPERMTGSFGLKPPASDEDTRAWLRLKGIRRPDADVDHGLADGRHSSTGVIPHRFGRYVKRSVVGRIEVDGLLSSWRNRRGDDCRRTLLDPCHLREMAACCAPHDSFRVFNRWNRLACSHRWPLPQGQLSPEFESRGSLQDGVSRARWM